MAVKSARRSALKALLLALLAPAVAALPATPPRIGLALGSGGARGLAHVLMFEVLDKLGLRPARISGASIGAVMGVLYAAGLSAREIRGIIDALTVSKDESWFEAAFSEDIARWAQFIEPTDARGGMIESGPFMAFLREKTGRVRFEELVVPLQVVATDFWSREQVVFASGELWPAVQASMALPGLFPPVAHAGRVLVDGGLVNPVPYDLLLDDCDITIAVYVLGTRTPPASLVPSYFDASFNTFQIMQASIVQAKLAARRPQIYVRPEIHDVRVLEFYRVQEIFDEARPAQAQLRRELEARLGRSAHAR